eukprot:m.15254 g.15254  ORF g.15254 m.15254 type:complete len:666 (+) comp5331_c0_seq2:450-2447(+)
MGRHSDLTAAAKTNDFARILEILSDKPQKGTFKKSLRRKKAKNVPIPVWPTNDDGSIKKMTKPESIRLECHTSDTGATPLILAAMAGAVEAMECLIAYGANVNAKDNRGNTALIYGAWLQDDRAEQVVDTLLKNGADTTLTNLDGDSAIHYACNSGKTYVLMMLLDANASPHQPNKAGETPLDIAARYNMLEIVSFLIDHDKSVISSTGSLRHATRTGKYAVAKLLLDFGMDVGAQEPTSLDSSLHIAIQFFRFELAQLLLEYGADPYLENAAGDTPTSMVEKLPDSNKAKGKFLQLLKDSENKEVATPAVELDDRFRKKAQEAITNDAGNIVYPELECIELWTKEDDQHRSGSQPTCPVTNVLDGKENTFWLAPGIGRQWIVFDFNSPHTITGFTVLAGEGKRMLKDFNLEVSPSLKGPWRIVYSGSAQSSGENMVGINKTFKQAFTGFLATSQYWRLHILRNHGAHETWIHQITFTGMEHGLKKFFVENGCAQYFDDFVQAGYNQLKTLPKVTPDQLASIVRLAGHRKKLELAIEELKGEGGTRNRLVFARQPAETVMLGDSIPPFEVHAVPGVEKEVEIVVLGDGEIAGTTRKLLALDDAGQASAVFNDISLFPAGSYLLQVQFTDNKEVFARAARRIEIEELPEKIAIGALFEDFSDLLAF